MKNLFILLIIIIVIIGCTTSKNVVASNDDKSPKISDTVKIVNEALEYEVIIIDPGFSSWINGRARPRGYYSESYLENKNLFWVSEWNNRVMQPQRFNSNLYEMQINYDRSIRYGYEVNYLIYNYLVYFQIANKQQLGGFVPNP